MKPRQCLFCNFSPAVHQLCTHWSRSCNLEDNPTVRRFDFSFSKIPLCIFLQPTIQPSDIFKHNALTRAIKTLDFLVFISYVRYHSLKAINLVYGKPPTCSFLFRCTYYSNKLIRATTHAPLLRFVGLVVPLADILPNATQKSIENEKGRMKEEILKLLTCPIQGVKANSMKASISMLTRWHLSI